jgi:SM-20-related protein
VPYPVRRAIVDGIARNGYAVAPGFLAPGEIAALRARAIARDRAGDLTAAAVGRGTQRTVDRAIRGDRIRWIDAAGATPAEQSLLAALDALRAELNRALQLGLFELEAHYAIYPAGAGYATHVDRFRDDDARVLSLVLYLNDDWQDGEGGTLQLTLPDGSRIDVAPEGGTLVAFLSDRFPHAVQPASRDRVSIAGWFRRRC